MYDTSTASNDNTDNLQNKKKNSPDVGRKKREKIREYTRNRVEGECRTNRTMLRPCTPEVELGCLGGF
jgi:hypothetical protein